MPYYVQKNPSDQSIMTIELRTQSDANTVCETDQSLVGKEFKIVDGVAVHDTEAQAIKDAENATKEADGAKRKRYFNRYEFAKQIKVEIAILNETKGWSAFQTQVYLSDNTIQQINALITDISFVSAKVVLESSDLSAYYSNEEKQQIIDLISNYLTNEI